MQVTIISSVGNIELELNSSKAPLTVKNFLNYVNNGDYNGTIFHRVIKNFMIQGGGFDNDMIQKKTKEAIKNEANNELLNIKYSVAMARTVDPHSATNQFFINLKDNDFLNFKNEDINGWGYAVFAQVIAGTEIVDTIAQVNTGSVIHHDDVPLIPIVIESIVINS